MNEATRDTVRQWVKKAESDWREISVDEMTDTLDDLGSGDTLL